MVPDVRRRIERTASASDLCHRGNHFVRNRLYIWILSNIGRGVILDFTERDTPER
jgi:hypothetical protein